MQTDRTALAAATALDRRICAIGGMRGGASVATVEVYTRATNTWAAASSLPAP